LSTFVVLRERGPRFDNRRGLREQDGWDEHAAFMEQLAEDGFVLLGGVLEDGRALHVVEAESEEAVRARVAADPWPEDVLDVRSVTPWEILLRAPRYAAADA
jgi:uncharacterized protein YciI